MVETELCSCAGLTGLASEKASAQASVDKAVGEAATSEREELGAKWKAKIDAEDAEWRVKTEAALTEKKKQFRAALAKREEVCAR